MSKATDTVTCTYCNDDRVVLYHGSGDTAEVRSCSVCGTGEKVADSSVPNVTAP